MKKPRHWGFFLFLSDGVIVNWHSLTDMVGWPIANKNHAAGNFICVNFSQYRAASRWMPER
jgi:hypothetical protein